MECICPQRIESGTNKAACLLHSCKTLHELK